LSQSASSNIIFILFLLFFNVWQWKIAINCVLNHSFFSFIAVNGQLVISNPDTSSALQKLLKSIVINSSFREFLTKYKHSAKLKTPLFTAILCQYSDGRYFQLQGRQVAMKGHLMRVHCWYIVERASAGQASSSLSTTLLWKPNKRTVSTYTGLYILCLFTCIRLYSSRVARKLDYIQKSKQTSLDDCLSVSDAGDYS